MPYTGIVLAILAFHAAAFLILISHWLVATGLFPRAVQVLAEKYETRSIRATLVGVFTYGPILLLFLNAAKFGPFTLPILALGFAALLTAFVGTAGLAVRIGRNLSPGTDPWQQVLRGGVMLALVFITPVLGSLFLMHVGLASGFGAVLLSRPWKRKVEIPPLESPSEAPIVANVPEAAEPVLS